MTSTAVTNGTVAATDSEVVAFSKSHGVPSDCGAANGTASRFVPVNPGNTNANSDCFRSTLSVAFAENV